MEEGTHELDWSNGGKRIAISIARGLHFLHSSGAIHRYADVTMDVGIELMYHLDLVVVAHIVRVCSGVKVVQHCRSENLPTIFQIPSLLYMWRKTRW